MSKWKNRIIGTGEENPEQLLANPMNARVHPEFQQASLKGVLDEIGWVQQVIVNKRTGFMIDGHLRVALAMREGVNAIPVVYVDLNENEEKLILATFDPITNLATTDAEMINDLINQIHTESEDILNLMKTIQENHPVKIDIEDDLDKEDLSKPEKVCPHCGGEL